MYKKDKIKLLCEFIVSHDGINDKLSLANLVQSKFGLVQDRKVYYCDDFAVRFSKADSKRMSNTVLSLSALQKYDKRPFIVCIVTQKENFLLLSNSTFLKKISHSSQELRVDNIKGSFNGSDIMLEFQGVENSPNNFAELFAFHTGLSFDENLERLAESTNGIVGRVKKFNVTSFNADILRKSVERAISFSTSPEHRDLNDDLRKKVESVQNEIAIAAFIDNVNLRGRIIEYLITDGGSTLKDKIIDSLRNKKPLVSFKTKDKLGDYSKDYPSYKTETDIKTKVLFLNGNPKAYNIDKLLGFLAKEKTIYMIYLLGVDADGKITSRLCSVFDNRLISATRIVHHWAGRNSRGVAQFMGNALEDILGSLEENIIEKQSAEKFLSSLITDF